MKRIGNIALLAFLLALLALPAYAQLIKKEGALITVRATGRAELGEGTKKAVKEKARLEALGKDGPPCAGHPSAGKRPDARFDRWPGGVEGQTQFIFGL